MTLGRADVTKLFAYFVALGLVIQLALLGVGFLVRELTGQSIGWNSALIGCAIAWVSGCVGAIPVSWKLRNDPATVGLVVLASTMLRFVTVLGLVAPLALLTTVDRTSLVMWAGAGYLVTLAADTWLAIYLMRRMAAETQ